ncbi:Type IV pilus assembly PilZ [Burkholderia sp. 8Y]|uniref:PilZ domain-containing protein n=1 Tax=Burkholderia sp. 8Y TaxID=2653133 RepID=UPI0012F027E7|nr:PilZ domain-containing protein [Burkholderia sp. 8Y]VXC97427.1 Type IV pilus assembly PilZ [Burkholderia sp. 8Y]
MVLVRVSAQELQIGTPLPFAVYSASGKLLLTRGYCVRSEGQRDRILAAGGFRDEDAPAGERPHAGLVKQGDLLISTAKHDAPAPRAKVDRLTAITGTLPKTMESMQLTLVGREHPPVQAEFVGSVAGSAFVVTAANAHDLLDAGVAVECKGLLGRKIYRFSSTVIGRSESPVKVVYFAYPQTVQTHIVRNHVRVSTELAGRLIRNDCVAAGFDVAVVNVSLGGVALRLVDPLVNVGEHFKLALRLRADGKVHAVVFNCIVRNLRQTAGAVLVGAEFSNRSVDTTALLRIHMFETATGSAAE